MAFIAATLFSIAICAFALAPLFRSKRMRADKFTADAGLNTFEKGAWLVLGIASPMLTRLEKKYMRLRIKLRDQKLKVRDALQLN